MKITKAPPVGSITFTCEFRIRFNIIVMKVKVVVKIGAEANVQITRVV